MKPKDTSEKIYQLEPHNTPLFSLLKENLRLTSNPGFAWIEDDLKAHKRYVVGVHEWNKEFKTRICPQFVICENQDCPYYKPSKVQARIVSCVSDSREDYKIDERHMITEVINLIEVEDES